MSEITYTIECHYDNNTLPTAIDGQIHDIYNPRGRRYATRADIDRAIEELKTAFQGGIARKYNIDKMRVVVYRTDATPLTWMSRFNFVRTPDNEIEVSETVYNEISL